MASTSGETPKRDALWTMFCVLSLNPTLTCQNPDFDASDLEIEDDDDDVITFLLMLPGLNQHGLISRYVGMAKREVNKLLKQKEKKTE
ncbi:AR6P1 protein, partial [Polypterus senegalus]